jgi:hypothetical protein
MTENERDRIKALEVKTYPLPEGERHYMEEANSHCTIED